MYPKVRFRGFDEPWKNKKFLTFSSKITKNSTSDDIDFPRIEFENIVSGEGKLAQNRSKLNHIKSGIKFDKGDILFGKLRPYLKNWWLAEFPGVAVGDFWVIRAKDNRYFLYYLIQAPLFEKVSNYTTGTKMPRSDWNYVSNTFFKLPKIDEQEKIGRILDKVDSLLSLQQRKLELENKLKKQIAFYLYSFTLTPNFKHIEVKNKKLGDIVNISNGIMGDSQKKSGNFKLTRIETISNGKIDLSRTGYIDQVSDEKKFLEVGDILYSNINSLTHIGKNAIVKEKHLPLVHGINLFRLHITNNQITPNYLHGLLNLPKYKWWVKSHANPAVNQASINKTELSSLVIKYPDLDIQNQINNINYSFAQYWDIQYSKKESLCQLKQFLLQNLFI
ncbi:restriction endonuclease subunit S [Lactobacillus jensenii]|uniref:restriction endonuclease subunit S n=1 Tax=Lactobacillus jensenii TaxID=109790 RepID=UPI001197F452|nr:restriction endonuclease subunit S [Lactobacillus jensenii]MDK7319421.1 restriction endonuclease subunit S [Lactobacillus jensenii]MDK7324291.1 restriction endonuclease subunit S [Lactobacillus jensenii]TVV07474.1 restriction endonuclease subunit S [Lactobacillus jensenii]TVV09672.1 restriction endonuclease subunit S [Lactobacillus jensenii]TVV18151.1 restriction endonuclease subunit S [Lactobacillus jensenii]